MNSSARKSFPFGAHQCVCPHDPLEPAAPGRKLGCDRFTLALLANMPPAFFRLSCETGKVGTHSARKAGHNCAVRGTSRQHGRDHGIQHSDEGLYNLTAVAAIALLTAVSSLIQCGSLSSTPCERVVHIISFHLRTPPSQLNSAQLHPAQLGSASVSRPTVLTSRPFSERHPASMT